MSTELGLICMVLPAFLLGLLFKSIGLFEVSGFIVGGILSYYILGLLGIPVETVLKYSEPFQYIGLALFSFQVGASIKVRDIQRSAESIVSTELILLSMSWMISGLISRAMNFTGTDRLVTFLLLINSSTLAVIAVEKAGSKDPSLMSNLRKRVITQTSLEDLVQFLLYGLFISAPAFPYLAIKINPFVYILQVLGFIIIVFIVAKYFIRIFVETVYRKHRYQLLSQMDLLIAFIIIALLFSTLFNNLGFPGLIGSFIAGLATAYYVDLRDVEEPLRGIRELGLLLYFSSIGVFIAPWLIADLASTMIAAVLGIFAMFTRFMGLFLGLIFSGSGAKDSFKVSAFLSSLSESAMILTYVLYRDGLVTPRLMITVISMTLSTLLLYPVLLSRLEYISSIILSVVIPKNLLDAINLFSRLYRKRVSSLIRMMSTITWFVTLSLVVVISFHILIMIGLRGVLLLPALIISMISLLVIHAYSLRRLSNTLFESIQVLIGDLASRRVELLINPKSLNVVEIARTFDKFIDVVMGFIGIALQVYLFYEYAFDYIFAYLSEHHRSYVYMAIITSILLIVYMGVRHYYKVITPRIKNTRSRHEMWKNT